MDFDERLSSILEDGIYGLLIGLALALLALVPSNLLSSRAKFWLGVGLAVLLLVGAGIKAFYEDLNHYRDTKTQVQTYLDTLPQTVQFSEYNRTVKVKRNGDSEVKDHIRIKNISDREISSVAFPIFCDVYEDRNEISGLTEQDSNNIEVHNVSIRGNEVSDPEQCYNKKGILMGTVDKPQERGYLRIPFNSIGGLNSSSTTSNDYINVVLNYTAENALSEAFRNNGDYVANDVYHPTGQINITIYPPENHEISIHENDHQHGIDIQDIHGKMSDQNEISEVGNPRSFSGDRIDWEITKPKLNYRYSVYFKCVD